MAIVKYPFYSIWASGKITNGFICRAVSSTKFVMASNGNAFGKLGAVQKLWRDEFIRKNKLIALFHSFPEEIRIAEDITEV